MSNPANLRRLASAISALLVVHGVASTLAAQSGTSLERSPSTEVRCVLTVANPVWKAEEPALIRVRLENLTDRDLDLEILPVFYLRSADEYSAPTDIIHNRAIETREIRLKKKAVGLRPVPIKLRLAKNSSSIFEVDATKTFWEKTIQSVWPASSLRIVPPGPYSLRLDFYVNGMVRSNEVSLVLESAASNSK